MSKGSPTSSSAPSYSGRRFLPTAPPFLSSDSSVPECPLHGLEPSTQDRPVTAIPGYILDLSRRLGSSFRPTKLFLAFCRTEGRFLTLFLRELKPRRILPGPTSPIPADGVLGACASLGRSGGVIGVRLASRLKTVRKSVCVCVLCAVGSRGRVPALPSRALCSELSARGSGTNPLDLGTHRASQAPDAALLLDSPSSSAAFLRPLDLETFDLLVDENPSCLGCFDFGPAVDSRGFRGLGLRVPDGRLGSGRPSSRPSCVSAQRQSALR